MTEFGWVALAVARDAGLAEVVERHWHEVGVHKDEVPLAVDWDRYHRLEDDGTLKIMAAWRDDTLVGYASFLVMPQLHYCTTLHALNDAIYVAPEVRGVGIRLIRESEKGLRALGDGKWVRIVYHAKAHIYAERGTIGPLLERMGYGLFESCYDKVVR